MIAICDWNLKCHGLNPLLALLSCSNAIRSLTALRIQLFLIKARKTLHGLYLAIEGSTCKFLSALWIRSAVRDLIALEHESKANNGFRPWHFKFQSQLKPL